MIIFIEKLDKKAVFAAHLMMSGTRTPASQFVNFCHWPCSPAARKPETKTAFFSDASFSHEKRRRFAKTCSGEGDTQKRRVGNKTKRSGARVCAFAASKQASKHRGSSRDPHGRLRPCRPPGRVSLAHPEAAQPARACVRAKTPLFFEFSLCLSQACLGKMMHLYINGAKSGVFRIVFFLSYFVPSMS